MSSNVVIQADDESKYNDEGYMGVPFPREIGQNGPIKESRCTDMFCCIFFLAYIAGMGALGFLNMAKSKVGTMSHQLDSDGKACGYDKGYENYPYLMMFSFSEPYKSACVKHCPKFDYNQIKYNSTGSNTTAITPVYFSNFSEVTKDCKLFINFR